MKNIIFVFLLFLKFDIAFAQTRFEINGILKIKADNVNLRQDSVLNSTIICSLKKGTELHYNNEKTSIIQEVNWNGKLIKGHWHRVYYYQNEQIISGWLFEKALDFNNLIESVYFPCNIQSVDNEYIKTEESTKEAFGKLKSNKYYLDIIRNGKYQKDSIFAFPIANGETKYFYNDIHNDGEGSSKIEYLGELPSINFYVFQQYGYENRIFCLLNKNNGKMSCIDSGSPLGTSEEESYLNFSPQHNRLVLDGSYYTEGIQFMTFKEEMYRNIGIAFHEYRTKAFRWIDNNSGIGQFEIANKPIVVYIKFILK